MARSFGVCCGGRTVGVSLCRLKVCVCTLTFKWKSRCIYAQEYLFGKLYLRYMHSLYFLHVHFCVLTFQMQIYLKVLY